MTEIIIIMGMFYADCAISTIPIIILFQKWISFFSNQNYQNLPKAEFDKIRFGRGISMVLINTEGVIVFMNNHEGV